MSILYLLYVVLLFLASLLALGLTVYAWRYRHTPGAKPLALLMLAVTWWGICATVSAISSTQEQAIFWGITLRFNAVIFVTPLLFYFTLSYTGRYSWLTPRWLILLLVIPAITLILNFTSPWHHLFIYHVVYEHQGGIFLRTEWPRGGWFWIYTTYSYLLLAVSLLLLLFHARQSRYPYRQQAFLTLGGALLPFLASIVTTFDLIPGPDFDLIVLAFNMMGLALGWALFNYRLLEIMPIARDAVVENMGDMVIVLDNSDRVEDVNAAVLQVLDRERWQVIGRPADEVFASWSRWFQAYKDVQDTHAILEVQTNGRPVYLDIRISSLKRKTYSVGRVLVLRDITSSRKIELSLQNALKKTAALYQIAQSLNEMAPLHVVFETIVESIVNTLSTDRVALIGFDWQQESVTYFIKGGLGAANIQNVPFAELMAGLSGWVLRELKPALSLKGEPDERESEAVRRRRQETNCGAILVAPLLYREKMLGTITAINRPDQPNFTNDDVELMQAIANQAAIAIETTRLYESEQQKVIDLQEANDALDVFAQTAAHDLKNPLTIMLGYAEFLTIQKHNLPPIVQQHLASIQRNGYKMRDIIESLLLLSYVRKKEDLIIEPCNITRIIEDVMIRLQPQIEATEAEITVSANFPPAMADPLWVEMIWVNYLSNALKYGGTSPKIELGYDKMKDGFYRYWVQDHGPGLTPNQQKQLFKPFIRLTKGKKEGHGLGLSIVRQMIERLGGEVGLESQPGWGSIFYFTLPECQEYMKLS